MKNIMLAAISGLAFIFVIPAMAYEVDRASIGLSYTMSFDNIGSYGTGLGMQIHIPMQNQQIPIKLRASYMSLSGNYYDTTTWSATVWGVSCILDWRNDSNWIPYAGIGVDSVNVSRTPNNQSVAVTSPVSIVGLRYEITPQFAVYGELDSISVIQALSTGMDYKF